MSADRAFDALRTGARVAGREDTLHDRTQKTGLDERDTMERRAGRAPRARRVVKRSEPIVERRRQPQRAPRAELEINVAENWQVRWWCEHLGVTHRQLFEAIAAVGVSATAVRRRLGR